MVSRDPGMNFRTVSKMVWAKQNHIFMAHLFWLASFFSRSTSCSSRRNER